MTEAEFIAAQQNNQVTALDTPPPQELPPTFTLDDAKEHFDVYLPFLEQLRQGVTVGKIGFVGTQSIGTTTPYVKVTLNTKIIGKHVTVDTVNNRLTIQNVGTYAIYGQVTYQTSLSGQVYALQLRVNGVDKTYSSIQASLNTTITPTIADVMTLKGGDYIELAAYASTAAAISSSSDFTFLFIHKL